MAGGWPRSGGSPYCNDAMCVMVACRRRDRHRGTLRRRSGLREAGKALARRLDHQRSDGGAPRAPQIAWRQLAARRQTKSGWGMRATVREHDLRHPSVRWHACAASDHLISTVPAQQLHVGVIGGMSKRRTSCVAPPCRGAGAPRAIGQARRGGAMVMRTQGNALCGRGQRANRLGLSRCTASKLGAKSSPCPGSEIQRPP